MYSQSNTLAQELVQKLPAAALTGLIGTISSANVALAADFMAPQEPNAVVTEQQAPQSMMFQGSSSATAPAVKDESGLPEGNQWRYSEFINAVQVRFIPPMCLTGGAVGGWRALLVVGSMACHAAPCCPHVAMGCAAASTLRSLHPIHPAACIAAMFCSICAVVVHLGCIAAGRRWSARPLAHIPRGPAHAASRCPSLTLTHARHPDPATLARHQMWHSHRHTHTHTSDHTLMPCAPRRPARWSACASPRTAACCS